MENIQQKLVSSKLGNRHHPAIKPPSKGYFRTAEQEAWVELIDKYSPFHWFCTLTFRSDLHPDQADKKFYRWIRSINIKLYGGNYRTKKKGICWVKSIEYQKRNVLHIHSLVGSPELYKLKRLDWMKQWETDCGRKSSRFKADPNRFDRVQADPPEAPKAMSQAEWDFLNDLCPELNKKPASIDYMNTDEIVNGFARIYKYDSSLGGKNYVAKYVTKGCGNVDMYVPPTLLNLVNNKEQGRLALHN